MVLQTLEKTKPKHRKGLWSPEEDHKLRNYILKHGHGCWSSVPIKSGLFLLFLFVIFHMYMVNVQYSLIIFLIIPL